MNRIGLLRALAGCSARSSMSQQLQRNPIIGRRDKSACPKRCKPLTRLAFRRACRSVAGMKPGFSQLFQGFGMHAPENPLTGVSS
jgi:hypothetical protein